jgi:hypothetical protein
MDGMEKKKKWDDTGAEESRGAIHNTHARQIYK